jgi:hypothetical protein
MEKRYEFLRDLFDFEKPLDIISSQLKTLDWDFEGEPLVLTRKELVSSLRSFLAGKKSAEELEHWANLIEMREDIDFDEEFETLINDTVYKLANPKLEGELTKERCQNYLTDLEK